MNRGWSYVPRSPVIRGYDTSALFREDSLERIKHLQMEVDADMKKIKQMEKGYAATDNRLCQLKKEFGWID